MPTPDEPQHEHPSTYMIQDRSNEDEMTRLQLQDQFITSGMGGVLPEQKGVPDFGHVLDVGCGTGSWLLRVAKEYPALPLLAGVDVSQRMVDYARQQAVAQKLGDRVEYHVMDALRRLDFPQAFFDLVNQRFGMSYLRTWDWPKLLREYQRVCKPGGIVRVSELSIVMENNSPALLQLMEIFTRAFRQAGHLFSSDIDGITNELPLILRRAGLQDVKTHDCWLEYRAGTPEGQQNYEDMRLVYRTAIPFFQKWTRLPANYETIYLQMLKEMQQPDFYLKWHIVTAWGINGDY